MSFLLQNGSLFRSFFLGGFECSTHRLRAGRRLDMIAATHHDRCLHEDYARLHEYGIRTVRDGIRWHLIETQPGRYDFSTALPQVRAAREAGLQVIWDLFHYGWPDDIDLFAPAFIDRFARFAAAFARLVAAETDDTPFYVPVNEISFFSWAAGHSGYMAPFARRRGAEVKRQMVRAAIAATAAIRAVDARARFVAVDPLIHVAPHPSRPQHRAAAEGYRLSQYEAWDMLAGRSHPELGGAERYLDIIGVNYYRNNQWVLYGHQMGAQNPQYRSFTDMLDEAYQRYRRPLLVAETGTEGRFRVRWLRERAEDVRQAMLRGVPIEGICLYPIVNFPGWDNDRHCQNGLWDYCDESCRRAVHQPLADELLRQSAIMEGWRERLIWRLPAQRTRQPVRVDARPLDQNHHTQR